MRYINLLFTLTLTLTLMQWRRGVRSQERDKLDRLRSIKLTVPPSSDARPL